MYDHTVWRYGLAVRKHRRTNAPPGHHQSCGCPRGRRRPELEKRWRQQVDALAESTAVYDTIQMTETRLQDWYGVEHQPMMTNGMRRSMQHVERLEGADYEIAFMRSTIRHHWGAIRGRDVSGARRAGGASPSARTSSPRSSRRSPRCRLGCPSGTA